MKKNLTIIFILLIINNLFAGNKLQINDKKYFDMQGLSIFAFTALYPEGHQGGIDIIQHGNRVATNGNLFLQPTPGQFQPVPKLLNTEVLKDKNCIIVTLQYPDSSRMTPDFNPTIYPEINLVYDIKMEAVGKSLKVSVDLKESLPKEWIGKVGFNLELFPADLFGKSYYMDDQPNTFPRYANTGTEIDAEGEFEAKPMAVGKQLTLAPETPMQTMIIESKSGEIMLIDGRVKHNNGWYVVRENINSNETKKVIEWTITPNVIEDWKYGPVVHTSQLGYHSLQEKIAIIETGKEITSLKTIAVKRLSETGGFEEVMTIDPTTFDGEFLRYNYFKADFSKITKSGLYVVECDDNQSNVFRIDDKIYKNGVWQPVLEYFLPVQMCHMKVFEKYRVWHDRCHMDDALMAPGNIDHFDGYAHKEVPEGFEEYQHIEELDQGAWHDAGDYDLRSESQLATIYYLALAVEEFGIDYDQTTINQEKKITEIHRPDGKSDALQQIEHGLLSILGGYHQFGKMYRGIICPTIRQYVMLGDAGSMTDNEVFDGEVKSDMDGLWYMKISNKYSEKFSPQMNYDMIEEHIPDLDDRMIFLDKGSRRQLNGVYGLAAASRVLRGYNDELADECLKVAKKLWQDNKDAKDRRSADGKIKSLVELLIATGDKSYEKQLIKLMPEDPRFLTRTAADFARVMPYIKNNKFYKKMNKMMVDAKPKILKEIDNPFGIPYTPGIWGAGWSIQSFGVNYYFLHKQWPEIFTPEPIFNALNFVLGCHPGMNTNSFATNVGTNSQSIAYGVTRADFAGYPGGVASGTNLIRPDFPEMKDWPFMWQQTEYMIGGGSMPYMFLVLAVDELLDN